MVHIGIQVVILCIFFRAFAIEPQKSKFRQTKIFFVFLDLTARLSWINWENLGVHPGRRTLLTSLTFSGEAPMPQQKFNL